MPTDLTDVERVRLIAETLTPEQAAVVQNAADRRTWSASFYAAMCAAHALKCRDAFDTICEDGPPESFDAVCAYLVRDALSPHHFDTLTAPLRKVADLP